MKKIIITLFIITAVCQCIVPLNMMWRKEDVIKNGKVFLFKTQPIDPTDYLRGKYISLYFEHSTFKIDSNKNNFEYDQNAFITIGTSKSGEAFITNITKEKPQNTSDYFKTTIYSYPSDSIITVNFPFDKFYMEENKAPVAEKVYIEANRDTSKKCFAKVFVKDGETAVTDVVIDGVSIVELSNAQKN